MRHVRQYVKGGLDAYDVYDVYDVSELRAYSTSLMRNYDRPELRSIAAKIAKRILMNIAQHFCRHGEWVSNIGITVFHRPPKIKCSLIDIAKFDGHCVPFFEITGAITGRNISI